MLGNQDINCSLIRAAREGRLERVRELINSYGLSYSKDWANGYVLLCDAIKNRHSEVAKLLLTKSSKVNSKNSSIKPSDTPLHFAVRNGDTEIINILLEHGANIDAKNKCGETPLHNAIRFKKMEVVELLLKHNAYVNAIDNEGMRPLHAAVRIGNLQIIELLLRDGAYINCVCTSRWENGYTPLHFAVEIGNGEVITLLLNRGAAVDIKGVNGITPLHIAAWKGYTSIAEILLNHGACIHSLSLKDGYSEGYTPLHFAAETGNEESVKLFLNRGADINASTKGNLTPLYIATQQGRKTVVRLLLQHGAKVDNENKDNKTILNLAVEKGYLMIVEEILKYCPDIDNKSNKSSLNIAVCRYGEEFKKIVVALLEYGLHINPEDTNDSKLLHTAVEKGYYKIVEDLLKYGADVNTPLTCEGFTLLHIAIKYKQEEVAKLLIRYEADINARDKGGKPPMFYAIDNADFKITKLLLTNKANVKDNPELLNIAVKKGCIEIVEALLQYGADINASDECGRTALHFTAFEGDDLRNLFRSLVNEPADVNINGKIAKLLLNKGANVDAQTKNGVTTLHEAIKNGKSKVVEALLEYNANVNSGVTSGIPPLYLSAEKGFKEICIMLLNKGADVNAKVKIGATALHIAIDNNHYEVVKLLLECGAKIDSKLKWDITPLHLAALKGDHRVIETILKFGVDINSKDQHGRTALHIASLKGHGKVVASLLEYGSDINITSIKNLTPLDYAMVQIRSFSNELKKYDDDYYYNYAHDDDFYDGDRDAYSREVTAIELLIRQIVKMQFANLFVSEKNFVSMNKYLDEIKDLKETYEYISMNSVRVAIVLSMIKWIDEMLNFEYTVSEELNMMHEKINNTNVSFYEILAYKGINSLAKCMRNENIVQVLKADDYKTKFPIYASMIKCHFRKGMERNKLIEQGNKIFYSLPLECTEKIFSYLSDEDLKNFNSCLYNL